jgi:hypothetical protein
LPDNIKKVIIEKTSETERIIILWTI